MLLRQVQARPLQGNHLRALWRRGDAAEGAPRAHGPHRPRRPGQPHLVLQGRAQPDRLPARHRPARAREGALLRSLDRDRGRRRGSRQGPERPRGQGQVGVRADLRRPRRGARRARAAAPAAPRLLREGQGQGLRRGRRLVPRARELGRGGWAAHSRRCARSPGDLPRARRHGLDRGPEEDPRARPSDGDAPDRKLLPASTSRSRMAQQIQEAPCCCAASSRARPARRRAR